MRDPDDLIASEKFAFSAGVVCACMILAALIIIAALAGCGGKHRTMSEDEKAMRELRDSNRRPMTP